jgi:hypothetical protein
VPSVRSCRRAQQVTTTTLSLREGWQAGGAALQAAAKYAAGVVVPSAPLNDGSTPLAPAAPSGSCEQMVREFFPDDAAWAVRTAYRESGCTAGAVNAGEGCDTSGRTNSHAMGPMQMCFPLHQAIFAAVGCGDPLDLVCGLKAARELYNRAGRSPWGGG